MRVRVKCSSQVEFILNPRKKKQKEVEKKRGHPRAKSIFALPGRNAKRMPKCSFAAVKMNRSAVPDNLLVREATFLFSPR